MQPSSQTDSQGRRREPIAPGEVGPVVAPVSITLQDPAALDKLLQGDTSSLASVTFDRRFGVHDEHVVRLVDAVGPQLASLRLGNPETGEGSYITDAAVLHIAENCSNLVVLQLESCVQVSTAAFVAVTRGLQGLIELHCTGHDRSSGALTAEALDPLLEAGALPKLVRLFVTDQGKLGYKLIQRLIKERKGLKVLAGETDGDSMAWGCVMQQMGQTYGDGLFGNMDGMGGGVGLYGDMDDMGDDVFTDGDEEDDIY